MAARWAAGDERDGYPRLAGYEPYRSDATRRLRRWLLGLGLAGIGLVYGFLLSIFPVAFYLYLAFPIVVLIGLIVWALPETDRFPDRWLERLLFVFLLSGFLWPNYLAIALPGLPWITINRLVTLPMMFLLLVSLSMAPTFRAQMKAILLDSKWITWFIVAFVALQVATLPFSRQPGESLNRLIDAQTQWIGTFFVAAYVFSKPGRARRFMTLFAFCAVILGVLAIQEKRVSHVLWAGHVPWFLKVEDEAVQRILAGGSRFATGIYRIQSTFSTSLNFAEFLALATPVMLFWAIYAERFVVRLAAAAFLPFAFWVIIGTDSRLGVIGFFLSFILYLGMWGIKRWVRRRNDIVGPWVVLGYPVVAASFFFLTLVWQRLSRMVYGGGPQQASNESRTEQYRLAIGKLARWPFGNGINQGADTLGFTNLGGVLTIDSYYILIALEYGVAGFIAFYGCFFLGIGRAIRVGMSSESRDSNILVSMAIFLLVFIQIKAVLAQDDSHGAIFMALGLIVGLSYRERLSQGSIGKEV